MTDERDKADAKTTAGKTQQQADNAASVINSEKPSDGKFNWWDKIVNIFVDHDSGKPDWIKILLTGLGGVAGAVMGADAGIGGMLLAGAIGTLVAGFATATLMPMARNDDPNATHRNHPVSRPFAPDPNVKVIAQTPVKLGNRTINVPTYNPSENEGKDMKPGIDPQLRTAIENLRKVAAKGNQYDSPSNKHLRDMVDQLESKANIREINLRYLRDTLPQTQQTAVGQVEEYLSKLGPDAQAALSIKLNVDINKVPGMKGSLGDGLERYGRTIKSQLLNELAASGGNVSAIESQKAIDSAWDNMSVVAKRNFINNFANEAIQNAMNNKTADARAFFPESETPFPIIGYMPSFSSWVPDIFGATLKAEYRNAAGKNPPDFETMANILDKRLAQDPSLPENERLNDGLKQQMKTLSLGMHAKGEVARLDNYIAGPLHSELEQLVGFETALKNQNQRIASLSSKVEAMQGKTQPVAQGPFPQNVRTQLEGLASGNSLAFQITPSSMEASNNIPTKPVDLKKKLANPSQSIG